MVFIRNSQIKWHIGTKIAGNAVTIRMSESQIDIL